MSLANDQVSMSGSDDTSSDTYKHSNGSEVFEKGEKCNFVDEELDEMLEEEKQLSQQALDEYKAAQERAGVIYISRIPPGMNPNKVRHLMGAYGEIGRVYLQQEDPKRAYLRKKFTTTKKPQYTEGWIEFKEKKVARSVAEMLNAQPIGGKKGTRWAEDVWTMKYLPRFKWYMLTEQIAHERAEHEARLRLELSQSKREQKHYLKQVEIGKSLEKRKEKQRKREETLTREGEKKIEIHNVNEGENSQLNKKHKKVEDARQGDGSSGSRHKSKTSVKQKSSGAVSRDKQKDLDAVLGSIF